MSARACVMVSRCVTSAARQPSRPFSAAIFSALSGLKPTTMTLAPAALAWIAAASPMPEVPPKMTTVRSARVDGAGERVTVMAVILGRALRCADALKLWTVAELDNRAVRRFNYAMTEQIGLD